MASSKNNKLRLPHWNHPQNWRCHRQLKSADRKLTENRNRPITAYRRILKWKKRKVKNKKKTKKRAAKSTQ